MPEYTTMPRAHCLFGGPLFDGWTYYSEGHVIIEDGLITAFGPGAPSGGYISSQNVEGRLLTPGFVDLHCDALEKCIELRPGARFDHSFALESLDRRLAANGVTSFYHAVAFLDTEMGLRSPKTAAAVIRSVRQFADSPRSLVRHGIHIRFEVSSRESARTILELLSEHECDLFSIMDHSPGQGQFKTMESFLYYYSKTYSISLKKAEQIGLGRSRKSRSAWEDALDLLEVVRSHGIPILSHDDDTAAKVDMVRSLGAAGSEFPVSLEAAGQAKQASMHVCMGAPNLLRGQSTNENVTAAEILKAGLCDTLVSDYSPESLPQSPFFANRQLDMNLADSLPLVTSSPGSLIEADGVSPGRLRLGAEADLAIIDPSPPWIRVWETWVKGRRVYSAH